MGKPKKRSRYCSESSESSESSYEERHMSKKMKIMQKQIHNLTSCFNKFIETQKPVDSQGMLPSINNRNKHRFLINVVSLDLTGGNNKLSWSLRTWLSYLSIAPYGYYRYI